MAKQKMLKLRIIALRKDRKKVLEKLQRLGAVEPRQVDYDDVLRRTDTSQQRAQFEDAIKNIDTALGILQEYDPEKKPFLSGYRPKEAISGKDYRRVMENSNATMDAVKNIIKWHRETGELKAENIRSQTRIDQLEPWLGLDIPVGLRGTSSTRVLIGTMPRIKDSQELLEKLAAALPEVDALETELIGTRGDISFVSVICLKRDSTAVENALRGMGFAHTSESGELTPAGTVEQLRLEIESRNEQADRLRGQLLEVSSKRQELQYLLGCYQMRAEKYSAIEHLGNGENVFVLEGWAVAKDYDRIAGEMEKLGAFCEQTAPQKGEEEPVALRNNAFTEGGAPVLEMFSMPSKGDIDPTPVMAFFYYLLFGIMLGDAVYGLIMVLATGFVLLKFKPDAPQRRSMKLFFFSGLFSIFWGVLFGSYCGDLPNVIAKTFFGATENVVNPILLDPISQPMNMLYLSIALGVVHIFMGLGMGIAASLKNRDIAAAIFDYLAWITMVGGIIAWALLTMIKLPFEVPAIVPDIILGVVIASVVGILIMNGRSSKNIFKRLAKGAYALYGVTSYLSDIMSYSRILALGLATGVISQVFNQMGSMVGSAGGVVGAIGMAVVCLIGHAFNIGISLIGCYVHTCRLQYIEFFGKFYEGGGKKFEPLSVNTKFFKLKEEN